MSSSVSTVSFLATPCTFYMALPPAICKLTDFPKICLITHHENICREMPIVTDILRIFYVYEEMKSRMSIFNKSSKRHFADMISI